MLLLHIEKGDERALGKDLEKGQGTDLEPRLFKDLPPRRLLDGLPERHQPPDPGAVVRAARQQEPTSGVEDDHLGRDHDGGFCPDHAAEVTNVVHTSAYSSRRQGGGCHGLYNRPQ